MSAPKSSTKLRRRKARESKKALPGARLITRTSGYRHQSALACQPMSALTTIQLREHAAAIKWLVFSKIKTVR